MDASGRRQKLPVPAPRPYVAGRAITMISPDPLSARKISPLGPPSSQRGTLKLAAYTFTRNPAGTVGRNPAGGFVPRGPLPDELVAYAAAVLGFLAVRDLPRRQSGE